MPFWDLAGLPPAILDGLVGRQLSETLLFVEQFCNRWEVQFGPANQRKKTTQEKPYGSSVCGLQREGSLQGL